MFRTIALVACLSMAFAQPAATQELIRGSKLHRMLDQHCKSHFLSLSIAAADPSQLQSIVRNLTGKDPEPGVGNAKPRLYECEPVTLAASQAGICSIEIKGKMGSMIVKRIECKAVDGALVLAMTLSY